MSNVHVHAQIFSCRTGETNDARATKNVEMRTKPEDTKPEESQWKASGSWEGAEDKRGDEANPAALIVRQTAGAHEIIGRKWRCLNLSSRPNPSGIGDIRVGGDSIVGDRIGRDGEKGRR